MSDAIPLPPRPDLDQYKKLARELQRTTESADPAAARRWAERWVKTIDRLQGVALTPERRIELDAEAERLDEQWRKYLDAKQSGGACKLADAQFFVARAHGFASWPRFAEHIEAFSRAQSPIALFETAADAIVAGDLETLTGLLAEHPELVRARSTRDHRSTLLHYVSANGIEDFRQRTPRNIVEITRLLLDGGADVNAESDAYAGRSTTLGLTATSVHPETAGVQLSLMELLIERGARIDGPDGGTYSAGPEVGSSAVNGCLQNGRGAAAEFLAARGARLDLEAAAGVGRLDVVMGFFGGDGKLKSPATKQQMENGFAWACQFGRNPVVQFLLDRGMTVAAKLKHDGQTGLHWAAYEGHAATVRLLLQYGAPVDAQDDTYGGTPLGWALYGWGGDRAERYYEVVAELVRAGAKLDLPWFEADSSRRRVMDRANQDPRMRAALANH